MAGKRGNGARGRRLPFAIPREEWDGIIEAAGSDRSQPLLGLRDEAICAVLFFSMLRRFEVAALAISDVAEWKRVDTSDPQSPHTWLLTGFAHVRHGKGDKERWASLPDAALDLIEAYLDVRPDQNSGGKAEADQPLFISRKSNSAGTYEMTGKGIGDVYKAAGGRAGYGERLHAHLARHSGITRRVEMMEESGETLLDIAEDSGHESLDTLKKYYHLAKERRREKARKAMQ